MTKLSDFKIDWNKVEEIDFEPLPAGRYAAKVTKSEIVQTKKGDHMVKLVLSVLGANKGKNVFAQHMLTCKASPNAAKYGRAKIKSLAKYCELDFDKLDSTSELHDIPVGIKIKLTTSDDYGDKNEITSYFEYSEDLLEGASYEESVEVADSVDPDIVEDEPEVTSDTVTDTVEEEIVVEDAVVVEDSATNTAPPKYDGPGPDEINAMKQKELIAFVKGFEISDELKLCDVIKMAGMKVGELKQAVIDTLFGVGVEDEGDDIVIDG